MSETTTEWAVFCCEARLSVHETESDAQKRADAMTSGTHHPDVRWRVIGPWIKPAGRVSA